MINMGKNDKDNSAGSIEDIDLGSMSNTKSGFAAMIGRPNVGKSTLMNRLIGQKIAITSPKPQTTRDQIRTVYTDERGQVIFLDTPGIHKAKNKLGEYMDTVAVKTLNEVDVVLWLVEPSDEVGPGDAGIAKQLKKLKKPLILVINKMDTLKNQDEMLACMDAYKNLCDFSEIVPVSALKGTNTGLLMDLIFKYLPYGPLYYDEDTVTDQTMRQIAAELIREKALLYLNDEIPHGIAVVIDKMSERPDGIMDIEATIVCEKKSHKGIIIGKDGQMLKKIASSARRELESEMECKVNLQVWVKYRKEWRDSETLMREYGYDTNKI